MKRIVVFVIFLMAFSFSCIVKGSVDFKNPRLNKLCAQAEDNIYSPRAMKYVDAFFKAATRARNKNAMAEAYKQKIYIYALCVCNMDSAKHYLNEMKTLLPQYQDQLLSAKKFIIYGYQDAGKYNLAVNECKKMLNTSTDSREVIEAYMALVEMYYQSTNYKMAAYYADKVCTYAERYAVGKKDYHYKLAELSVYGGLIYTHLKKYRKAYYYLHRTDSIVRKDKTDSPSLDRFYPNFLWYGWASYFAQSKNYKSMNSYLARLRREGSDDSKRYFYSTSLSYFDNNKLYAKALEAQDSLTVIKLRMDIAPFDADYWRDRAEIFTGLGRKNEALDCYKKYALKQDSLLEDRDRVSASEFAEMLQTNNLRAEKDQLELEMNRHKVIYLFIILAFAGVIIILLVTRYYYLRRSKQRIAVAHEKLEQAYNKVEQLSNMKSSFIQNMSHEIRTPLNGIVGFAEIISSSSKDNPECAQYSEIIERESKKLQKVVDDVIQLSSLESDVIETVPVSLHSCCQMSVGRLPGLPVKDITFEYSPSDENLQVLVNEQLLVQVIDNLLNNAFKFTTKGKIVLAYVAEGDKVLLTVTDTGCGIPTDKRQWVFERFSKVDAFTQGSGLGLAISRLILNKMNGNIAVDSHYTNGCRIIVTLRKA